MVPHIAIGKREPCFKKGKKAALSERKFNMISSQKTSFSKNHKMNMKITKKYIRRKVFVVSSRNDVV